MASLVSSNTCNVGVGQSRVYVTDLLTGETLSKVLQKPGLSPEPVVIVVPDGSNPPKKVLCIATECFQASDEKSSASSTDPDELDKFGLGESQNGQLIKKSWWEEIR